MQDKQLFRTKQSVFCSAFAGTFLWISNKQYLDRRTKYDASTFFQLYEVCFAKAALEGLSKTMVAVGLVQIGLLILVAT